MTTGKGLPRSLANNEVLTDLIGKAPLITIRLENLVYEVVDGSGNSTFLGAATLVPTSAGFTIEYVEVSAP